MMTASTLRAAGLATALAVLVPNLLWAQDRPPPRTEPTLGRSVLPAPVGHRQPRAADIPQTEKTEADRREEQQQAELNRRLRICRGC